MTLNVLCIVTFKIVCVDHDLKHSVYDLERSMLNDLEHYVYHDRLVSCYETFCVS